jgi:glycerol-3-phosphate acyltransferase PlsY
LNFKGGKAMATTAGMIFFIEPLIALLAIVAFILVFVKKKIVSIASLTAAGVTILLMLIRPLLYSFFPSFFAGLTSKNMQTYALESMVVALIGILILVRHMSNLKRLGQGKEFHFLKHKNKTGE